MIKRLILKNVQSHAETALDFSPGINCIIGSSNAGKTAILRALYWVVYNRPLGIDTLASHWVLTEKGGLKDEMSVLFENDRNTVIRRRTKGENQYEVNGKVLNVVKSDVPQEVSDAISLTDTNIQRQLDEPFLLSQTSGEVARYFNRIVRLDVIDRVLGNAEATRRKVKVDIEATEEQIAELEKKVESYNFLPVVEKLLNKYHRVETQYNDLDTEIENLKSEIEKYEEADKKAKKNFDFAKGLIDAISEGYEEIRVFSAEIMLLKKSISDFEGVRKYPDFSLAKGLICEISEMSAETNETIRLVQALRNEISAFTEYQEAIRACGSQITSLEKQLPDVCPLCGGVMKMEGEK